MNFVSINPQANANNVALNGNIDITFDQLIDGSTLNINTVVVKGHQTGVLAGMFTGGGTSTITFNPGSDFRLGEIISVTITTSLLSQTAMSLARGHTYSFTAISGAPPATPLTLAHRNISFISSITPEDVAALDFDKDGDLDILVASEAFTESTVLWKNDGNQTFCSQSVAVFRNVEVYDIDGDGDFDSFGSTGAFDTELNWFKNDGTNTVFTEQFINSEDAWTLTGGDLDSDGDIDLVTALLLPDRIRWFNNDGSGGFGTGATIVSTFTGGSDSYLHVVDMNEDGAMDILGYLEDDRKLVWYENDGALNFTERLINTTTVRQRIAYADIDGDGDMDILSTNISSPAALSWYENDGSENFTERPLTITAANSLRSVKATDLDGDMDMDIVAGAYWFENDGAENFTEHLASSGLKAGSIFSLGANYADLDSDGDMDMLTLGSFGISWQENGLFMNVTNTSPANATLTFAPDANISITFDQLIDNATVNTNNLKVISKYSGVVAGTFSGGGTNTITFDPAFDFLPGDLIEVSINEKLMSSAGHSLAITYGFRFTVQAEISVGTQFTSKLVTTHTGNASGLDVADVDGDGDLDLVSCSFTELFWHRNDGTGNFTSLPIVTTATPTGVLVFDFDGDGDMDILVDNDGNASNKLYTNDGAENFSESSISNSGKLSQITDVDNNGEGDLVYLSIVDNWVSWAASRCGGFNPAGLTVPRIQSRALKAADMDGDGDTDFIAASTLGPSFYSNDGYLNFTTTSIDAASTIQLDLADLDGDGDLDPLFVQNFSSITWYENRLTEGTQDFGPRQEIAVLNMDPRSVVAADIDGDGDADVAAVSRNNDRIVWYKNRLNEVTQDFGPQQLLPLTADGPIIIKSADLNGDRQLDLIVLSDVDEELAWFENVSTACSLPQISLEPIGTTLCENENYSMAVTATGSQPFTYQWQKGGVNIPGAPNAATLTLSNVTVADAGAYRCIVTNLCGSDTSSDAILVINASPLAPTATGASGCAPSSVTLMAAGSTDGNYRWYDVAIGGSPIPGEVNGSFATPSLSANTNYYVSITNGTCESNRTNAMATITQPVSISVQPVTENANFGDDVTFTISATGDNLTYQWKKDGADLTGKTTASLLISNVTEADQGNYTCVVSNTCNSEASSGANLTVVVTGISQDELGSIIIYPNPSGGYVHVRNNLAYDLVIKVFTVQGKEVAVKHSNSIETSVNLSDYPDGIYYLAISNGKSTHHRKVLIRK